MMSPSVKTDVHCGKCTRTCTGESCCVTTYENKGREDGYVRNHVIQCFSFQYCYKLTLYLTSFVFVFVTVSYP
jgi:hypothetical protein